MENSKTYHQEEVAASHIKTKSEIMLMEGDLKT